MSKLIIKAKPNVVPQKNARSSTYNTRLAVSYGEVESNNTDGTCNVTLSTGFLATNIKIPSSVFPSKDPLTGGLTYPAVGSAVVILHPENDLNSGWVQPAPLDVRDSDVQDQLLDQGDIALIQGGWQRTYDIETGKVEYTNGDVVITITPGDETIELDGTISVARKDDAIKSTVTEDASYWGWATRYNTFNVAWASAMATATTALGSGTPAATVLTAYFGAMAGLMATLSTIPSELTGKITEGSDKVKVG